MSCPYQIRLLLLIQILLFTFHHGTSQKIRDFDLINWERLAEGVIVNEYHGTIDTLPVVFFLVELQMDSVRLDLQLGKDQIIGQETVSSMVKRKGAILGINGGFSYTNSSNNIYHGIPRGFLVDEGKIQSLPERERSSFCMCNGKPRLVRPNIQIALQQQGTLISGFQLNQAVAPDDSIPVIYTSEWNATTLSEHSMTEWLINDKRANIVRHGSNVIPENGYIITLPKQLLWQPDSRGRIELEYTINDRYNTNLSTEITNCECNSAGPTLIRNRMAINDFTQEDDKFCCGFAGKHPRTAIGYIALTNTLLFLVADGRQPGYSMGLTLEEEKNIFKSLGCEFAYNLDGGGSSTLVTQDSVINRFSDARERPRCDAWLVYPAH